MRREKYFYVTKEFELIKTQNSNLFNTRLFKFWKKNYDFERACVCRWVVGYSVVRYVVIRYFYRSSHPVLYIKHIKTQVTLSKILRNNQKFTEWF